jgi:hypothetical protein
MIASRSETKYQVVATVKKIPRPGPRQALSTVQVERRVADGDVQVRQLVEEPDGEVGRDQRDVDDREASRVGPSESGSIATSSTR